MSTQTTDQVGVPEWDLKDRLGKAMEYAGIEVDELVAATGYSRPSIYAYLSGRTKPRALVIKAWAMRCGVNAQWLETGDEPNEGPDDGPGQVIDRSGWFSGNADGRSRLQGSATVVALRARPTG